MFRSELKIARWIDYGVIKISWKFRFMILRAHLTGRAILEQSERNRERCVLVGWLLTTGVSVS